MQAADKAQRQHLDNLRIEATEGRQRELEKGADQALHALAPIYSLVILQHGTYKQANHLYLPACVTVTGNSHLLQ